TMTRTTFGPKGLVERSQATLVGGLPTQVNVNVGVPRSYFVDYFKVGKIPNTADPDEATLSPIIQAQLAEIEGQVRNLITADYKAGVKAYIMNTDYGAVQLLPGAPATMGSTVTSMLASGWAKPAGLATLVLVSLGLMFGMVRKATRQQPMPTVQELAGVPPTL